MNPRPSPRPRMRLATLLCAVALPCAAAPEPAPAALDAGWVLQAVARPAPSRTPFVELRDSPMLADRLVERWIGGAARYAAA